MFFENDESMYSQAAIGVPNKHESIQNSDQSLAQTHQSSKFEVISDDESDDASGDPA
jgi:hypothetical protein